MGCEGQPVPTVLSGATGGGRHRGQRAAGPTARRFAHADWFYQDVAHHGHFSNVCKEVFRRDLLLDEVQYLGLVRTFGSFLSRSPEQQKRGLIALDRLVEGFGTAIVLDLRTTLVLATRGHP